MRRIDPSEAGENDMPTTLPNTNHLKNDGGRAERFTGSRTPHVAWVISGNRNKASSRLQGFLIHEWFMRQGISSEIVASDFNLIASSSSRDFLSAARRIRASNATHIVFEGPEWTMVQLAQLCRRWGKRVIAVRCDKLPGDYDAHFDMTILPTEGLRETLGVRRAAIIDDIVEVAPDQFKTSFATTGKIRIAWVGHASYEKYITSLVARLKAEPAISEHFDFELISAGSFASRQWSEHTVVEDVLACDIAFLPIPQGEWFQNKSSNRLAMMFSLGMPVVASRIASYELLARHGINALLADSEEQLLEGLLALRSPELRERLGKAGRTTLGTRFHIDHIGPQWRTAILSAQPASPSLDNWRLRMMDWMISSSAAPSLMARHVLRDRSQLRDRS